MTRIHLPRFARAAGDVATVTAALLLTFVGCSAPQMPGAAHVTHPAPILDTQPKPSDPNAWRAHAPTPDKPGSYRYPTPELLKLSNGLSVYYLNRDSGAESLRLVVSVGASSDPPEKSGLANLVAEMMVEATARKPHQILAEAVDALGSELVGAAGRDQISLSIDTLPSDAPAGLALLAEATTSPAFDEADFRRLKKQKLDELRAERQNPSHVAALVGMRLLFGPDLGSPVGGCPKAVLGLSVTELRKWYSQSVTPEKSALFLVGPLPKAQAITLAEASFGKWRSAERTPESLRPKAPSATPSSRVVYVLDRPSGVQSALFAAQEFPKHQIDGFVARQHLSNILGGLFTSRINQNLREKHAYTYGARTAVSATTKLGLFTVTTSVEAAVTAPAVSEILLELQAIRGNEATHPIESAELARSKADLIQGLGAHLVDSERIVGDLEQLFVHRLPLDYFSAYPEAVGSIGQAQVVQESLRLTPQNLVIVVVGDQNSVAPALKAAGFQVETAPRECIDP